MGDGCCHLVASLLGWREGGRERERELSPQSSENVKQRKQNVRAGNCEQTAERVRGGVRVLSSVVGVNVRGEKCYSPMLQINHIYQAHHRI